MRFLIIALVIAFTFTIGFILGSNFASGKLNQIASSLKQSELTAQSIFLEQQLIAEVGCDKAKKRIEDLSLKLWDLGKLIGGEEAEKNLGKRNYLLLKKKFHLSQIETSLLYKNLIEECNLKDNVIIFYFSRNQSESAEQGKILDEFAKKGAKIFAIEFNFTPELNFFERFFDVKTTPAIIINFNKKFEGLTKYEEIEKEIIT